MATNMPRLTYGDFSRTGSQVGGLEHYKYLANLAQRWSRGPFHAPPELRKYTARVPKEAPIGAGHSGLVDREFWLGEILGDIRREAERDLSREELASLDRFFDLMTERPPYKTNPGCPKENPAWVTSILSKHLVELEESIPAKWLPKLTRPAASRGRISAALKEYGCGAYGCVLPTMDPQVVLKLTTDDTEAQFAHELADTLAAPVVVKYHLTLALPERHKGRPSYLLWRDAAERVGELGAVVSERGGDGNAAEDAIEAQHAAARKAFEALEHDRPAAALLKNWEQKAREMGKVPELRELSDGMITNVRKNGVFMGDVHGGNIGRVNGRWVIIDPGHVAVLDGVS